MAANKLAAVLSFLVLGGVALAACGQSASKQPDPRPTVKTVPTPTLAQQVQRAQRIGPGFLDYCPTHNGRRRARFQVNIPGSPLVAGWCQTTAQRGKARDDVTFRAHWDAHRLRGPSGTMTLKYGVPRTAAPSATPVALLLGQSGTLPP